MLGRGYMAPEYAVLGQLSVKLDVYSLGVLILEIVTGRKNTDMLESAAGESIILLSYVSCSPTHSTSHFLDKRDQRHRWVTGSETPYTCTCIHDPST
jgi:serine/threonine protein kinase